MSGKLFNTRRMLPDEYESRKERLRAMFPECFFTIPNKKEDHGDIDMLYIAGTYDVIIAKARQLLNPSQLKTNGQTTTMVWEDVAVDFIAITNDFAKHWYSHGMHSANMGVVYTWYGFKLASDGLYDRKTNELLTDNWEQAMDLLDFPMLWDKPFTKEDLEEVIWFNEYTHKAMFVLSKKKSSCKTMILDSNLPMRHYYRKHGKVLLRKWKKRWSIL